MTSLYFRSALFIASIFVAYMALFMLVPALVDYFQGDDDWRTFVGSSFILGGLAAAIALATFGSSPPISSRFGFFLVSILWCVTSIAGALPFMNAVPHLSVTDAIFESVSALTTTGSTVISGLDALPQGLLLWRSLLQWIGGIGVIALGLFVLPFLKVGGVSYLKIESSDIGERPFARLSNYTAALVAIYTLLTVLCAVAYALAGMSGFDAINHALTTLATGGFSTHDASLGFYADQPAVLWVGTVFMFVAALPFSILILLVLRGQSDAARDPQIRVFAGYCLAFILVTSFYWHFSADVPIGKAVTHAAFNFVSIITTTGYASGDYTDWGPLVVACAFVATFLGGCSGSTSGGVKAYRIYLIFKNMAVGFRRLSYPHSVVPIKYGDQSISADMQRAVSLFIAAFMAVLILATLLLSMTGLDLVTSLTGSLTALTNVGPGLGTIIGPAGNFSSLPDAAKWILTVTMLLGRLEILAVLVFLSPVFWDR